jgi:hypothetical protein
MAPHTDVLRSLFWLGVPALVALGVYAFSPGAMLGTAMVTAAASFAVGTLLGFLFGIPRSLAGERNPNAQKDAADAASRPRVEPNTNLEQISDWLTKILVGVSLVQFQEIGDAIGDAAASLGPSLAGSDAVGEAVAVAVMASFAITGFLSAYLFTRLRLQGAFAFADRLEAIEEKADTAIAVAEEKAEEALVAIEERADADTKALALVRSQLDPGADGPTQKELNETLHEASQGVRAQAFYLARDQRRTNWESDKNLVALTIPIFRALIDCDKEGHYHRNRGELGYAQKDKPDPEFEAARDCLTKAIEIRGPEKYAQYPLYEFNRAVCDIEIEGAYREGKPSSEQVVERVTGDLELAIQTGPGRRSVRSAPVEEWVSLNAAHPRVAPLRAEMERLAGRG